MATQLQDSVSRAFVLTGTLPPNLENAKAAAAAMHAEVRAGGQLHGQPFSAEWDLLLGELEAVRNETEASLSRARIAALWAVEAKS